MEVGEADVGGGEGGPCQRKSPIFGHRGFQKIDSFVCSLDRDFRDEMACPQVTIEGHRTGGGARILPLPGRRQQPLERQLVTVPVQCLAGQVPEEDAFADGGSGFARDLVLHLEGIVANAAIVTLGPDRLALFVVNHLHEELNFVVIGLQHPFHREADLLLAGAGFSPGGVLRHDADLLNPRQPADYFAGGPSRQVVVFWLGLVLDIEHRDGAGGGLDREDGGQAADGKHSGDGCDHAAAPAGTESGRSGVWNCGGRNRLRAVPESPTPVRSRQAGRPDQL